LEDLVTGGEAKGKSLLNGVEERDKKEIAILSKKFSKVTVGGKKKDVFWKGVGPQLKSHSPVIAPGNARGT
jgi:hypothetical protein